MTVDAVMGLAILAILAGALAVGVNRSRDAGHRLSDTRGAAWAAEQALMQMQTSGKPAASDAVAIERLEAVEASSAPAGYVWVRVRAQRNGRSATLTGLVPTSAVPAEGGQP